MLIHVNMARNDRKQAIRSKLVNLSGKQVKKLDWTITDFWVNS